MVRLPLIRLHELESSCRLSIWSVPPRLGTARSRCWCLCDDAETRLPISPFLPTSLDPDAHEEHAHHNKADDQQESPAVQTYHDKQGGTVPRCRPKLRRSWFPSLLLRLSRHFRPQRIISGTGRRDPLRCSDARLESSHHAGRLHQAGSAPPAVPPSPRISASRR